MLYYFNEKVYILSSGYFKEVVVKELSKGNYDISVKEKGDKIEYVHGEDKPVISLEEAYKKTHKKSLQEEM